MAGREKNCKWNFADQPNGQEIGPNNAMEQNFIQCPYASLIRESIQNSLDAVLDKSQPVLVKYSFREMTGSDYPNFFELNEHIRGCLQYFSTNANAKAIYQPMLGLFAGDKFHESLGYIRVSDYNTKGMYYDENKTDSPFYAFVRSAGVSSKDDNSAGGSFGFGKAAYYLLSPISSIIVSTCTEKNEKFFEGISSLCTHTFRGAKKMAVGYYDNCNGAPITDEDDIPVKFRRNEPGTDINILGFDFKHKQSAIKEMVEAVLRNFWMAILKGNLNVEIESDSTSIVVNEDNIADLMEEYFAESVDNTKKSNYYNPRPYFDAVRFSGTTSRYVCFEDELPLLGHVCFYINKYKNATDKIAYLRAIQMLVYAKKSRTNYGIFGVFYCDSEKGNDILRNMENPAHDQWAANNWKVNRRTCPVGRSALNEIDNFLTACFEKLFSLKEKTAIDIKGLEEFLYIPTEYNEDMELESESLVGEPSGVYQNDGSSVTTDIDENCSYGHSTPQSEASVGHVMVNKTSRAQKSNSGSLRSGHRDGKRTSPKKGIQKPGDAKERNEENPEGESGIFAYEIDLPYRTFCQLENGEVYHYVVLHTEEAINNLRIHFLAVGEDSDEELFLKDSNLGTILGNMVCDLKLAAGRNRIRVRFQDNLKHSIKLSIEKIEHE